MAQAAYTSVELNSFKSDSNNLERGDDTVPLYNAEYNSSSPLHAKGCRKLSINFVREKINRFFEEEIQLHAYSLLDDNFVSFADQNLMAPNLSAIADEFNIAAEERDARLGGDVAVAFFIVGGPFGIIAGWYTDRLPRNKMYGWITCVGAVGSFCTSLVTSHFQLLCARALTGIAIGGAAPVLFSLLSDLFSVKERNLVVATVGFFMSFGSMAGQALSGAITTSMGRSYWKVPFLFISIPCFICGLLVIFTTKDPPRAGQEATIKRRLSATGMELNEATGSSVEHGIHPDFSETENNGEEKIPQYTRRKRLAKK